MGGRTRCDFTGGECDGGRVFEDGSIGCGFYDTGANRCSWLDDLPQGMPPRMFYNDLTIEAGKELGAFR